MVVSPSLAAQAKPMLVAPEIRRADYRRCEPAWASRKRRVVDTRGFRLSDGGTVDVHPDDLDELKNRDPKLQIM